MSKYSLIGALAMASLSTGSALRLRDQVNTADSEESARQRESLVVDIETGYFDDTLAPGYVPMFGMAPLLNGADEMFMYSRKLYRAKGSSGGQQKSRDVDAGRAAEKRARKARRTTRRNRK